MEFEKISKLLLLVLSFIMFCVQLNTTMMMNPMNPPKNDFTYTKDITEEDLPLVTICPTDQILKNKPDELMYYDQEDLLIGKTSCGLKTCKSWGAHLNITFEDILMQIYDYSLLLKVTISPEVSSKKIIFLPRYGFCWELAISNHIILEIIQSHPDSGYLRLLFTDKLY